MDEKKRQLIRGLGRPTPSPAETAAGPPASEHQNTTPPPLKSEDAPSTPRQKPVPPPVPDDDFEDRYDETVDEETSRPLGPLLVLAVVVIGLSGAGYLGFKYFRSRTKSSQQQGGGSGRKIVHLNSPRDALGAIERDDKQTVLMFMKTGTGPMTVVGYEPLLHAAARHNAVKVLRLYIDSGVDLEARNGSGTTPLAVAAGEGKLEAVKLLTESGAKVEGAEGESSSPWESAACAGHDNVAVYLLKASAKIQQNSVNQHNVDMMARFGCHQSLAYLNQEGLLKNLNADGRRHCMESALSGGNRTVMDLFDSAWKINYAKPDEYGRNLMYEAASRGWGKSAVDFLVEKGVSPANLPKSKMTPLDVAQKEKHWGTCRALLSHDLDLSKSTILHSAIKSEKTDFIDALITNKDCLNAQDEAGNTPLHVAADGLEPGIVKRLLDAEAKWDVMNHKGILALHLARDGATIKVFLENTELDVNTPDKHGSTLLLHLAAEGVWVRDPLPTFQQVTKMGAKINVRDKRGRSPLNLVCRRRWYAPLKVVEHLIDKGADVQNRDAEGDSPLHEAADAGWKEVVQVLIKHGADVNGINLRGENALHVTLDYNHADPDIARILIAAGIDVDATDGQGETALHMGCRKGGDKYKVAKQLIEAGARLDLQDYYDYQSPLTVALKEGSLKVADLILTKSPPIDLPGDCPLVYAAWRKGYAEKLLLSPTVRADQVSDRGATALHAAASRGEIDLMKALLKRGADPLAERKRDGSPLQTALDKKHIAAVRVLLDAIEKTDDPRILNRDSLMWRAIDTEDTKLTTRLFRLVAKGNAHNQATDCLSYAVRTQRPEMVKLFLQLGGDPIRRRIGGSCALDEARRQRKAGTPETRAEILKILSNEVSLQTEGR